MKLTPVATALSVLIVTAALPAGHMAVAAEKPAAEKASTPPPAPEGPVFSKVREGMDDAEVTGLLGQPSSTREYASGKQWIPGYMGSDIGRVEYVYKGQGRITLSRNRYTGRLKVIRVEANPNL